MSISGNPSRRLGRAMDPGLLGILAAALIARFFVANLFDGPLLSRTWEYESVALNILGGRGFLGEFLGVSYRALILPFYPAFCAAVYWLLGRPSLEAMQVIQAAAVVPAGWFAYALASELAGRRAGLLAALGVTFHPGLLLFSLRRHTLWFDAVIFLMLLWAIFRARRSARFRQSAALGALFGLALLSRATIGVFMFVACGWLAWQWRRSLKSALPHIAVICGVAFLIVAPWLVRNAFVLHQPIGLISTTSYNLWIGNNPFSTGGALAPDGTDMATVAPALIESAQGLSELDQQQVFRVAALTYIRNNPGQTALNYARKLRIFLFWSDQTGAWYPEWFRIAYQAFYVVLLGCATVGAYRLMRSGNLAAVLLCVGFVLSVGLVQSVYFVEGRHRWEVESGLIVLAACGIGWRQAPKRDNQEAAEPAT